MDEDIIVPGMFFLTIIALVVVIPVIKAWYMKQEAQLKQPQLTPELSARLDRLETMIETVSIEVERVSEGQRFTSRLLSESAALPVPQQARTTLPERAMSPEVTPHA
jgi:succinylarginine dihydrolase